MHRTVNEGSGRRVLTIPPRELELEDESAWKQGAEQSWGRGSSGPDTPRPPDLLKRKKIQLCFNEECPTQFFKVCQVLLCPYTGIDP